MSKLSSEQMDKIGSDLVNDLQLRFGIADALSLLCNGYAALCKATEQDQKLMHSELDRSWNSLEIEEVRNALN